MSDLFTNIASVANLYKKASIKSEVVTQILFGERFTILSRSGKWLKIRIFEDGYKGYIKKNRYYSNIKPTHKVSSLRAKVYKFPNLIKKTSELTFGSKIKVLEKKSKFLKFHKGWINSNDVKPISYRENNPFKKISIFENVRYTWGGKSFKGIDCSALIQVFLNFNNKFCPRDTKDQLRFFKKNINLKKIKKNDIIYWKGHVALALSSKKLIHAYGPMKRTVVMGINQTIKRIQQTAKLKVIGIKRL